MRVLVVDDEVKLAKLLQRALRQRGIAADVAGSGEEALVRARATVYDAIVLDVMLPGIDGLETCRRLRADGVRTPILMLTARGEVADKIEGLNVGADDYLTKPFAFGELIARLHAIARRGEIERSPVLQVDDLRLDPVTHRVWRAERELELSAKEFLLLATLMRHPGRAMTRQLLLDHAWDSAYEAQSNVVDVYIGYLREKVDRPFGRRNIETVRGVGYRLVAASGESTAAPAGGQG